MLILILLLVVTSLLLPRWVLLVFGIPLFMILAFSNILPPLLSIGDADIQIFDLILLIAALRVAGLIILRRCEIPVHPVYSATAFFLGVLLVATLIAYKQFGKEVFIPEMISFLRFLAQISVCFMMAHSIKTAKQLNMTQKCIEHMGYVIAAIIYLNIALRSIGFTLGEVQATEMTVRYFGPIGDQVGFILLFFIFRQLMARNVLWALFFGGALVATGTAGALLALGVGLLALVSPMQKNIWLIGRRVIPLLVVFFAFVGALIFLLDVGGLRTRLTSGILFSMAGMQRLLTAILALQVFSDHILTGVGYTGFRFLAHNYGAGEIFFERLGGFAPNYVATAGNQYLQVATDGGILALLSFFWLVINFLRTLKSPMKHLSSEQRSFFGAGYIWLLSLIIGNQTAVWLTPGSLIGYLLWIILGSAVAARSIATQLEGKTQTQRPAVVSQSLTQ